MYGRRGFKRKGFGTTARHSFAKKRRYSTKRGRGSTYGTPGYGRRLLPRVGSWNAPGGGQNPTLLVQRGPSLWPDRLRLPLRFSIDVTVTITAGAPQQISIEGNNIFDPSGGIGSSQPVGFTSLIQLYSRFIVFGSTCQAKLNMDNSGTNASAVNFIRGCLWADTTTTTFTSDIAVASAFPTSKTFLTRSDWAMGSEGCLTVRNYASTAKMFGIPKARVLMDDVFHGTSNANPTRIWYWNIIIGPNNSAPVQNSVQHLTMDFVYYTELYAINYDSQV